MKHTLPRVRTLAATIITFGAFTCGAQAVVILDIVEYGGYLEASYSGSVDLTDLSLVTEDVPVDFMSLGVNPDEVLLGIGGSPEFDPYSGISGPDSIGVGTVMMNPSSSSGDFLGIWNDPLNPVNDIWVPAGYTSGASISGASTWAGESLLTLGLTEGTYEWTWGSGLTADSLTVNISSVPEPTTSALLFGIGALGYVMRRRRLK